MNGTDSAPEAQNNVDAVVMPCDKCKAIFKNTKSFMMGIVAGSTLSQPTQHYLLRMMGEVEDWEIEDKE